MKSLTFKQLIFQSAEQLQHLVDEPRLEAEVLLAGVLEKDRSYLIAHPDYVLTPDLANEYRARLSARLRGEPYAYVVREREFWSVPLYVNKSVLIPRPETETLIEQLLLLAPVNEPCSILDLGTGSGAIAIACKASNADFAVTAVDQSAAALEVAKKNGQKYNLDIEWISSDWFAELQGKTFDFILSNPPYIAENDPHLDEGDVRFEPKSALVSGKDGLDDIRTIVNQAGDFLNPNGYLLIEHGYDQQDAVEALFCEKGYAEVKCHRDLSGQPRVTSGQLRIDAGR